jgi:hypothetical protein
MGTLSGSVRTTWSDGRDLEARLSSPAGLSKARRPQRSGRWGSERAEAGGRAPAARAASAFACHPARSAERSAAPHHASAGLRAGPAASVVAAERLVARARRGIRARRGADLAGSIAAEHRRCHGARRSRSAPAVAVQVAASAHRRCGKLAGAHRVASISHVPSPHKKGRAAGQDGSGVRQAWLAAAHEPSAHRTRQTDQRNPFIRRGLPGHMTDAESEEHVAGVGHSRRLGRHEPSAQRTEEGAHGADAGQEARRG